MAYWFLSLHWDSYVLFWSVAIAINACVFVFTLFLLPESQPRAQRKPFAWANLNPLVYYWAALKLIISQPFMIGVCLMVFTVTFGLGAFGIAYNQLLLGPLQYTQEAALIPDVIDMCMGILGNAISAVVIPRVGPWSAYMGGMVFVTLGFVLYGWWSIYFVEQNQADPEAFPIWIAQLGPILGGSITMTFAGAFATPAYLVIVSKAVKPEEQAQAQSMISLVAGLAGVAASPFWSLYVYKVDAQGQRIVLFAYLGAVFMAISTAIMIVTMYCHNHYAVCYPRDTGEGAAAHQERVRRASGGEAAKEEARPTEATPLLLGSGGGAKGYGAAGEEAGKPKHS